MRRVRARAPLRISFAGGGTDIPSFLDKHSGAVLNVAIDLFAYCSVEATDEAYCVVECADIGKRAVFNSAIEISSAEFGRLHLASLKYIERLAQLSADNLGLKITTFCEAPPGSGLGSSSTLTVAILKALATYFEIDLAESDLVDSAYFVEREMCGFKGGVQDHYSASYGGFNFIELNGVYDGLVQNVSLCSSTILELESLVFLYSLNISRDSGAIIESQSSQIEAASDVVVDSMKAMQKNAYDSYNALKKSDLDRFFVEVEKGWEFKKMTSRKISSGLIDEVHSTAMNSGAIAGKVSGAGGGGHMWFLVPIEKRVALKVALDKFGGEYKQVKFCPTGSVAWFF